MRDYNLYFLLFNVVMFLWKIDLFFKHNLLNIFSQIKFFESSKKQKKKKKKKSTLWKSIL